MFKELMRFTGMVFATSLTCAAFVAFAPVAKSAEDIGVAKDVMASVIVGATLCGFDLKKSETMMLSNILKMQYSLSDAEAAQIALYIVNNPEESVARGLATWKASGQTCSSLSDALGR